MGFTPGARVTVVSNYRHSPVLVLVHGSRVALGRGEAAKVFVRPDGDGHGD
jgi:ferrous iron transport protein A